jgi:3,4-dihydroxy-2-butanone 4-phosphate synthase
MKLTKKDRAQLIQVLAALKRGQQYILSDRIVVACKCDHATTTEHLTNGAGLICYPLNKEIGSELALLHTGIDQLHGILFEGE